MAQRAGPRQGRPQRGAADRQGPAALERPEVAFDNGPDSEGGKLFEWHGGITPFNYGRVNLGLLERWPNAGFGAACELVCNRDGGPLRRVAPGMPFLDVGPEGAFDRTLAYPTHNAPIRVGDVLHIFYTGGGAKADAKKGIPMAIGLATLRLDRFATLAAWRGREPGRVLTRPLRLTRPRLELNVESFELHPPRVAVLSEAGAALPGFGFDDCTVGYDARRVYAPVRWKGGADLGGLRGKTVKLHFEIRGAALYGYRFVP